MSEPVRIGLIGAGAIVQVAHLPVLTKLKTVAVAAICDVDLPKARALAERFQINAVFDDIEDLLGHEQIDAILVATPNHLHEPHVLAGLSAGCHVLVEKPGSLTPAGEQRIARLAEKKGRTVMIGMTHRYRPDAQAVRSFVQSGELGEIDSIRASWHVSRPARAQLGWRTRKDEAGGGAVLDLGLTMVDLCLWLAGNPTPSRVSANLSKPKGERGVEQSGSAFVVCEEGLAIFVDVTWRHIGERERFGVGIRGSKGTAGINPLHVWKELNGVPQDVSPTGSLSRESAFTASFRAEWAHFLAAIAGDAKVPPLSQHITLLKVIDAIYKSAAEGKDVSL
ncbi:MAG TPA: Gfo/Idh/MocA family oxidoreductase [Gemmatimonadales bacterium]|nr:Gfo/Idh/MocA family oxidoreductase [Gemmatimonadales bacterium]